MAARTYKEVIRYTYAKATETYTYYPSITSLEKLMKTYLKDIKDPDIVSVALYIDDQDSPFSYDWTPIVRCDKRKQGGFEYER